jgi:hypothetical protein
MNESPIKTLLTVLPVLSAGLYLLGATYHQGYLGAFGIDDSMFQIPIDRLLFSGFVAFITFGLMPIVYSVAALVVLFVAVVLTAILSSVPQVQHWQLVITQKLHSFRSSRKPSPTMNALVDKSATLYAYTMGGVMVVVLFLVVAVLSSRTGREQAQREIDSFLVGKGNYVYFTTDQLSAPTKAKQIICGNTHCAFWLGQEAVILKHEQVKQIVTHNPSLKRATADLPAAAS